MHSGQLIAGRYRLDEQVGAGGMGIVWRATDEELGRVVAVKRARSGHGEPSDREVRREARIAAGVHHSHVVTLFDVVTEGADRWLVMEYVPSRSLAEILQQHGALPAGQVARIGAQIAEALEAVHAKGIVHRDVKPGNTLVTDDGTAKLTDFGISRAVWGETTVTDSSVIPGTPAYLAPEVANGEDPATASDVFSLGAALFAAVEGTPPFGTAENPLVLLRRAAAGEVQPPRRAGPLAPVLAALLAPDPADRPGAGRARELLQRLAENDTEQTVRAQAAIKETTDRVPQHGPRRRTVAIAGAATVAVAVTVAVLVASSNGSAPGSARAVGTDTPSSAPVMGDARTADPCALTDSSALLPFGDVSRETDYGNFDRCDVIVEAPAGVEVDVKVQLEGRQPAGPAGTEQVGKLRIARQPEDGDECLRTLLLADRSRVTVEAGLQDGAGSVDYCAIADVATNSAVGVLERGEIPRRSAAFDAASLARLDACRLLDADAFARIPGIHPAERRAGFAGWECDWDSTTSDTLVKLVFDRNQPLGSEDGRRMRLHGHETYVEPEGDGAKTCVAQVVYRPYSDRKGRPMVELVRLVVDSTQPVESRCTAATELAAAVAARLPPR